MEEKEKAVTKKYYEDWKEKRNKNGVQREENGKEDDEKGVEKKE